ncbi:MAG TPA: tRNA (guanosine(46)-N7)-methyltransferase TrmB [Woeseiaceae bacterium]|nr:tRNA (guanosine(46)-N7)-methyltransferase TrmB [Woeseiaceae bacterium]
MEGRRRIRSYVLRSGRTTPAQERAISRLWPRFGLEFTPAPLDFVAVFGRDAPRVLEIGFGDGDTLVEQAAADPACDYIGIEVHKPGIGHCLLRAEVLDIDNLRVIAHDAVEVLEKQIPAGSLRRINLYFPDPWPKKRHHKRRLVNPHFLEILVPRLKAHGRVFLATDWEDLAMYLLEVCDAFPGLENLAGRGNFAPRPAWRPPTKFERRGLRQGFATFDLVYARSRAQISLKAESA